MSLYQKLQRRRVDKIPRGWHTISQLAAIENVSPGTMARLAPEAHRAGLLERRLFVVAWGDGFRARPHYRYTK